MITLILLKLIYELIMRSGRKLRPAIAQTNDVFNIANEGPTHNERRS